VGIRRARQAAPGQPEIVERDDRILLLPAKGLAVIAPPAYATLLLPGKRAAGGGADEASAARWRQLVERIDAEDGAMPEDGVLMMTGSGIFRQGRRAEGDGGAATPAANWDGLPLPGVLTLVVGTTPGPFLEITGDFERRQDALAWEREWPNRKRQLLGSAAVLFGGVGPIVSRIEVRREEDTIFVRTTATKEELLRVLNTVTALAALPRRR
jgi:hypothetical protein